MSIEEIPNNPFLSGYPIYPCNLVGRKNEAETILRYLPRVIKQGIPEHFHNREKRCGKNLIYPICCKYC